MFPGRFEHKLKIILSMMLAIAILFCASIFFLFPKVAFGESFENNDGKYTFFESEELLVKGFDVSGFPEISFYLNFQEGSRIGLLTLDKDDFIIKENNVNIKDFILQKAGQISEPVAVAMIIDTSGSMKGAPIENAKAAAKTFISQMRDIDQAAVVGFSDMPVLYCNFTQDKNVLNESVDELKAGGGTALFDGIIEGMSLFNYSSNIIHKYLVILSDGADTVSLHGLNDVLNYDNFRDVVIYSIALKSSEFNPEDIENMALKSGGQYLETSDPSELVGLYSKISEKIINQYKITYRSPSTDIEDIFLSMSIEKLGLKDFIEISYKNPSFSIAQTPVTEGEKASRIIANIILPDIWWMKLIIYLLIFVSVTVFIYIISTIMVPNRQDLKTRTDYYLYNITEPGSAIDSDEKKPRFSFFKNLSKTGRNNNSKRGFSDLFDEKLKRAGISIAGTKFMLIHIISVTLVTLIVFLITRNFMATFCVVIFVIFLPFLFINFKTSQKIKKFNEQLPDTLQLIEGALKAGYSLNQSLVMVIKETKPPISEEFAMTLNEIRMGLDEKAALENMAKRINSELFNWVVLAINIQREVGGNLAEIMDIIANTIRDKERVMRQIKSLTAEGKLSAYVLIGLPIILGLVLSVLNREYISVLFTTRIGFLMLFLAAGLMISGILWIIKIIKIEY